MLLLLFFPFRLRPTTIIRKQVVNSLARLFKQYFSHFVVKMRDIPEMYIRKRYSTIPIIKVFYR